MSTGPGWLPPSCCCRGLRRTGGCRAAWRRPGSAGHLHRLGGVGQGCRFSSGLAAAAATCPPPSPRICLSCGSAPPNTRWRGAARTRVLSLSLLRRWGSHTALAPACGRQPPAAAWDGRRPLRRVFPLLCVRLRKSQLGSPHSLPIPTGLASRVTRTTPTSRPSRSAWC